MKISGIGFRNLILDSSVEYKTLVLPGRKEIENDRPTTTNKLPRQGYTSCSTPSHHAKC